MKNHIQILPSPLQELQVPEATDRGIKVYVKRDDLIDPQFGGNKFRKLLPAVNSALLHGRSEIVTFGGPFSNHVVATAALCRKVGLHASIYIRGEIDDESNPVLAFARAQGADLIPMKRADYARRNSPSFLDRMVDLYSDAVIVPEGGSSPEGIAGCAAVVEELKAQMDSLPGHIIVPSGTGGTALGIAAEAPLTTRVHGIVVIEEKYFRPTLEAVLPGKGQLPGNLAFEFGHDFGGLAKWTPGLIQNILQFEVEYGFKLDPVYTGKAWYALLSFIRSGKVQPGQTVVFIHTGGKAGRMAFNYRYGDILPGV